VKEKQTSTDEKKGYSEDRVLTANKAKVPFPSLLQALSILLIFLASKLTLQGVFQLIWEDRILENDPLVFFTRVLVYVTPFLITFLLGNLFRRGMPANGSLINPSYEFSWLWLILALGPLMFFRCSSIVCYSSSFRQILIGSSQSMIGSTWIQSGCN
jgi:hypothetical protein